MKDFSEQAKKLTKWYADRHCKCCRSGAFEIDRDAAFEESIEFLLWSTQKESLEELHTFVSKAYGSTTTALRVRAYIDGLNENNKEKK